MGYSTGAYDKLWPYQPEKRSICPTIRPKGVNRPKIRQFVPSVWRGQKAGCRFASSDNNARHPKPNTKTMKTLLICFALLTGSFISAVANGASATAPADSVTYKLTVEFANVVKRTGMIYVALVNNAADFNGKFYRKTRVEVPSTGDFQVNFDGLPAGQYAVQVFQDLNDNQKLDFNGVAEPFGFSNITSLLGPPSFAQAAFDLNTPKTVTISLIGQ
ncbi:DUF2141 domain-containing protein [Spirosoma taeanense]|uniref:DUF2141 domain-containing protein n=1 Tax=Spirosoma taeanense TaxID=2735870 RepID=A0A6M5Y6N2_9BACT|nr:DUF2141 domain-containing protein [Spirosoma taeanense]QJW88723.1 DUF2141 domain-containing protein [Spirosoma taeanense]